MKITTKSPICGFCETLNLTPYKQYYVQHHFDIYIISPSKSIFKTQKPKQINIKNQSYKAQVNKKINSSSNKINLDKLK